LPQDKIDHKVPLTDCFPFYTGACDALACSLVIARSRACAGALTYEDALRFVRNEFLTRNRDSKKNVYPHVTCGASSF
jgi:hypothetical protein